MAQVPASSRGLSTSGGTLTGPEVIAPTALADTALTITPPAGAVAFGSQTLSVGDGAGHELLYADATGNFELKLLTASGGQFVVFRDGGEIFRVAVADGSTTVTL